MIEVVNCVERIDREMWGKLIEKSSTATWFQTCEAYDFFAGLPDMFIPFVYGVIDNGDLKGVCVGYITKEKNRIKQLLTRRAIITGGPMLADEVSEEEVEALLNAVMDGLRTKAIYIETRNLNDYSRWKEVFEKCRFEYVPHLNFHVDCTDEQTMMKKISESKVRQIKKSLKSGAVIIKAKTEGQIEAFYQILYDLYKSKVKTPLFPKQFFLDFFRQKRGVYLLVCQDGKVIGGIMCPVLEGRTIYEWFVAGLDVEYKTFHPSIVSTYAAMKYGLDNGISRFDFMGAGAPGDGGYGVRDFKAKFGGELVEHGRFLHVCNKPLYSLGKLGVNILKRYKCI